MIVWSTHIKHPLRVTRHESTAFFHRLLLHLVCVRARWAPLLLTTTQRLIYCTWQWDDQLLHYSHAYQLNSHANVERINARVYCRTFEQCENGSVFMLEWNEMLIFIGRCCKQGSCSKKKKYYKLMTMASRQLTNVHMAYYFVNLCAVWYNVANTLDSSKVTMWVAHWVDTVSSWKSIQGDYKLVWQCLLRLEFWDICLWTVRKDT